MSRSESKSAGAARKKIQETGVAHSHAHFSMSTRKNERKNSSRRKFLLTSKISWTTILHAARILHAAVQLTVVKTVKRLKKRRNQRRETVNRCASISGGTARRKVAEKGVSEDCLSVCLSVSVWYTPLVYDPSNPSLIQ